MTIERYQEHGVSKERSEERSVEIKAYAKINLTLEVLGRRDDGYHEVSTILQTIDLADRLHFTPAPGLELVVSVAEGIECSGSELNGEDNLVWRAANSLRRKTGCDKGVKIHLEKQIPIGMGLGGGSSDAAAALKALNSLWNLGMDDAVLLAIARSLGSDVPYFLLGGTALGEGRGDVVTDLSPIPERTIVLLCPSPRFNGEQVSAPSKTARIYSMLTKEHYTDGSRTRRLVDALEVGRVPEDMLFNVFEQVTPSAFQRLTETCRDFLEAVSMGESNRVRRIAGRSADRVSLVEAERVHLSGTGPALYALASCQNEGEAILESLKRMGQTAYCVNTVRPGASLTCS